MKIFMWGVMSPRGTHPEQLHFRQADAKDKARQFTNIYKGKRKYWVQRFLLDMKSKTYYDVYKHKRKII